jgi:hypothetical protein
MSALGEAGFAVTECEPDQARDRLSRASFALLVTNWASHLADERIGVPVIFLSSEPADIPRPVPARARVVQKPFDAQAVVGCARQLLMSNPAGLRRPVQSERTPPGTARGGASG